MNQYDPNISWARQKMRVTFQQWDYQLTIETTVNGNCKGFGIFESAISNVFDALHEEDEEGFREAHIDLMRPDGETLEVEVYNEEDLYEMVVKIEIIEQVEYKQ